MFYDWKATYCMFQFLNQLLPRMLFGVLMVGLLAACAGTDSRTEATQSPTRTPGPRIITNTPVPEVERPDEAAGEIFRPDPVALVANTGNPQLVEIFSYD